MANFETLVGAIANGDMSTMQFTFVTQSTAVDFEVGLTTASTIRAVGVLQNNPNTSGHGAEVAYSGICKLSFGGTIAAGANIISGTDGRGVTESTALNDWKLAIAMEAGTATGVYLVRLLSPYREGTA